EQYVDEEIKQTLLGVKQMKEMMEKKEEKHRHLMDALRHSSDKKEVKTEQKLEEAEQRCRDLTKSSFGKCRPCLEDSCKAFYTSTCRRGFASFSFKLDATEHVYNQNQESSDGTSSAEITEDRSHLDLSQAETSFSQLSSNISLLYDRSISVVQRMQQVFGRSFQAAFTSELQPGPLSAMQGEPSAGFLRTVGLDHVFDSVFDFGKNVVEKFSSTVADAFEEMHEAEEEEPCVSTPGGYLCRQLRRQASECWQLQVLCETCKDYLLKECPSVQQLHSETEEMYMLLNASRQQYDDRLQLVQRHTADTQKWLSSMDDKFGWISQLSNSSVDPQHIFRVITNIKPKADRSVVVSILDSTPITVLVPADLEVDDPAFIQYVAQEALTLHKQQIKGTDLTSVVL
uniref:Clusterin n=1 Tax=Stegastes partitus TaxID=144197 RepID=A0A3B5A2L6_9TELE